MACAHNPILHVLSTLDIVMWLSKKDYKEYLEDLEKVRQLLDEAKAIHQHADDMNTAAMKELESVKRLLTQVEAIDKLQETVRYDLRMPF